MIIVSLLLHSHNGGNRYENLSNQLLSYIESKEMRIIILLKMQHHLLFLFVKQTCSYHGQKMSSHDKLESFDSWQKGLVKVMVCTTAFGMGIDQPDVDLVIRIGCPPTLECMVNSNHWVCFDVNRNKSSVRLFDSLHDTIPIAVVDNDNQTHPFSDR